MSRYRHWCFTLNNYTEDDVTLLSVLPKGATYLCYGKEVGESGTPHLQGFISFENPARISSLKKLSDRSHWSVARDVKYAVDYCKKEGDFLEVGTPPKFRSGQGKRSDLEALVSAIKAGETSRKRLREDYPAVCAKYPEFVDLVILDQLPEQPPELYDLLPWQREVGEMLGTEPSSREIIFIVDPEGNNGKSWFVKHYSWFHKDECIKLVPGKKADTVYAFISQLTPKSRVVFFDAPRSKQKEYIQYDFLEELKNGLVFNNKYHSRIVEFQRLHVVVLMNEQPDMSKLTSDRYNIVNISHSPAMIGNIIN